MPISEFLLAVVAGLFAFGGWHVVTYTAEETVAPERTIPRALGIGIAIVTLAYVALNAVYFYILPVDKVLASTRVAADAAAVVLGNPGALAISALVMFSVFGAMMGSILAAPRVYFAMARDGLLFQWVNHLHPRFGTPHRAIALQAIWASVLGTHGHLSSVVFARDFHRVDLLRAHGGRDFSAAAASWIPACLSRLGLSVGADRLRPGFHGHRHQPAGRVSGR